MSIGHCQNWVVPDSVAPRCRFSAAALLGRFSHTAWPGQRTDLTPVVVAGILIDDGNGSGQDQSGSISRCGSRARCRHEYLVAEAYPVVRERLAFRNTFTDELDDLRRFGELAVMKVVAGLDFCEVDDGDLVVFKFLFVWRLLGVDGPKPGTFPQTRRENASARSSRETNSVNCGCCFPMSTICERNTSTSTSGAASMTFLNFAGSLPLRIAI